MTAEFTNHLAAETSPYLLQHARNPVDWYPWGSRALETARSMDKPILLSIGYSACHWCHVMAHESFEDPQTARLMNERFVNIKVDREERPDLDKIYQLAHQLLTQRGGGWPLTMFLTPRHHVPFFGGTYFPRVSRYGLPDFKEVLRRVADFYRDNRGEIEQQNRLMLDALERLRPQPARQGLQLSAEPWDLSRNQLGQLYDAGNGGFGGAPKFPHPPRIAFLIRHWSATALTPETDGAALDMATHTLDKMARGGLYDHLGGGFYRYAVDGRWTIPHFEKMLYDNGQLLVDYAEAYRITADPLYAGVIHDTARWVMRDMQSPEGGYYSTLDADSEGREGRYYLWTRDQAAEVLTADEYAVVSRCYGLDQPPNFEGEWHLQHHQDLETVARETNLGVDRVRTLFAAGRDKLFGARERRVPPGRDDKVLTAWNGLMIKGMAAAGRVLPAPAYGDSAARALSFLRAVLWKDGRLEAVYKDGAAHGAAYLDDYVFVVDAVLELLQVRWRDGELRFAVELAETVLRHFEDGRDGGFYFTADDHERLIQRPKTMADDALPAGNGIAALVLGRLGHLLGEPRYLDAAERTLKGAWSSMTEVPHAHDTLLMALDEYLTPPELIVLRGTAEVLQAWTRRCHARYAPRRWVFSIPEGARDLTGNLALCVPRGDAVAYVCRGASCSAPITRLEDLDAALSPAELPVADTHRGLAGRQ